MATSSVEPIGASVRICDFRPEPECMLPPIQGFQEKPLVSLEKAVESLIDIVPQLDHMVWTVKQSCHQPKDGLSTDESASIMLYTLERVPQEKSFYFILNTTLRSQNRRELVPWFLYLRLFIFALSKLPSITPRIIFRGVAKDMRDEFPDGKTFIWWSFTSCTSSLSVLQNYLGKTGKRTIFNILCNEAKDISRHSYYRTENELLLYPARQFEVMSSFDGGNDLQILQLEETHPQFPLIAIAQVSTSNTTNILQSSNSTPSETFSHTQSKSMDRLVYLIRRTAIDSCGRIGSLYDGYRDCILEHLNVKKEEKLYHPSGNVWCDIIHGNNDRNQNPFRLFGIDEQLRLSILLELAPKTGIASLIDYPYTAKEYTRLFYYTHVHQTQQLPDTIKDARAFIQPLTSDTKATHIISRVNWGIDFIIVLELPHDEQAIAAIDHVLENICSLLGSDSTSLTLKSTEENILTKILHTKVYSNIPANDLYHVKTLHDVCQYIEQNRDSAVYHPVSYTLRPIKWLHPYYTGQNVTFIPLPKNLNDNIEKHVLQLRKTMKKRETSIYNKVPKLLCGYLNERLSNLQKQWSTVEKMYTNEIARLSKLVIDIRSGRVQIPTIDQALKKNEQTSMSNTMDNLIQYLNDLKEKGKLITSLTKRQFRYVDVTDYGIDRVDNEITIERRLIWDDQRDCVLCSNDTLNKIKPTELKNLSREMVEELNNNSNLRLIYADFSYCSFELQNTMKLPSSKYKNEHSKLKQIEATSFKELRTISSSSIKAQTSVRSPTKTHTSLPASSKVYINDTLSTKTQTNAPLPTKSPTFLSPVKEKQTPVPSMTKTHTTGPLFTKEQTDSSSTTKPQTYITSFTETQIFTPAPTELQTTDTLPTKIHSYTSTRAKSESPLPPFTEVHTRVTATTKLQESAPSIPQVPSHSPPSTRAQTPRSLSTPSPDNETINLLLLGEIGVGKSTFINALANYRTFNILYLAETGQPVVLIPVSFLITVGDNFDENAVQFGDVDGLKNEDFSHPGQSVTQRCKSYDFRLHPNDKKILRIIDTPGFGDTRGLDQDDRTMKHILEYIKNLSHLNAICFLLKPDESHLNIFLQSCLTQLFSSLGQNIDENIIFCFTHARSTFYSPGNTALLIKKMLNSLPKNDVPFTKDNTFCFDNESFRYLVALQNQIKFNDLERIEYEISWTRSVAASNRLLYYICEKLTAHRTEEEWNSLIF